MTVGIAVATVEAQIYGKQMFVNSVAGQPIVSVEVCSWVTTTATTTRPGHACTAGCQLLSRHNRSLHAALTPCSVGTRIRRPPPDWRTKGQFAMEYAHLGRTGLTVSRLGLGALKAAALENRPGSHGLMDRALEHGINYLDTSNIYGLQDGDDWSENVIGRWFAQGGRRRERTVLATKLYQAQDDWPNHGRLSALHIRLACDDSLRRLQTDYIDLYQMHHVDRETPWEEIWEAMEVLRTQGKILYVGSSNFAGWHIAQAQERAGARHFLGLVNEQSIYNLAVRDVEREVIPAIQAYGLGLSVWSPLHRGILGGILAEEKAGRRRSRRVSAAQLDRLRPQLADYEALCAGLGHPPARVALAWLLQRPGVTSAIIGPDTIEQLDDTVAALDLRLDAQSLTRLDGIFPGYRTAPEDYAW